MLYVDHRQALMKPEQSLLPSATQDKARAFLAQFKDVRVIYAHLRHVFARIGIESGADVSLPEPLEDDR
jgi:hypothetical protein